MRTIINRLIAVCPNSGRKSILKEFSNTPWMRTTLPQLSPYDVNLTLREHEYTHNFPEGCVKGYDSNQLGSNSPMEDTRTETSVLNTNAFLCGVYDGHGGSACSQVVSKRLIRYISTAIQDREHLKQVVKQGGVHSQSFVKCHNDKVDFVTEVRDIFEESYQSYLQYLLNETADTDDRVEAIINAFLHLDNHLSKEALEHSSVRTMAVAMSGTVACVGLIEGRELYLASPGDCTAVLGSVTDTGQWTLQPSKHQNFIVERILCAPDCDLIALAGSRGLSLLELPRRWGPNGQYLEGKDHIICKSQNVDVQFFVNNAPLELLQIRWHPASPTGGHILALISDNTIRVYDESTLKHVWRVGPVPSIPVSSATTPIAAPTGSVTSEASVSPSVASNKLPFSNVALLNSLGETAVDFDIAPPRVVSLGSDNVKDSRIINATYVTQSHADVSNNNDNKSVLEDNRNGSKKNSTVKEKVEWPIVVLRGNGNIYILCASIDTSKPRLQGPLTIQPQVADNYGAESCSILVIPSLPPTVVIAESTGKLYNGLLLEAETAEESFHEIDSSLVIHPSEWVIHILETVELELGLPDTNKNRSHSCPIHLKRDIVNELRFFAYHNTGLHVVMLHFIKQLQHFVESEEDTLSSLSVPSKSEYLICTKALQTGKINPILGFTLFEMPGGIIVLLGSGQVLSLNLISDPCLLPSWDHPSENKSPKRHTSDLPIQKIMSESFVTYIRNILKSNVTQPILSLDKTAEPAAQEAHSLLQQAIQVLKDQYFSRHEKARVEILKRVSILKRLKEQQQKEVELLELEKEKIRDTAEQLAEKYEDICDKQQIISRKCQELVNKANILLPQNTISDKDFIENVEKINEATKKMQLAIEQAKKKINQQKMHINNFMESGELKHIDLPPKQEKTIKEIITQITLEIESQIKEIKYINNVINF